MIGILIYIASTSYMPQFVFLIAAICIVYRERQSVSEALTGFYSDPKSFINWNFLIILIIVLFSFINRMVHWDYIPNLRDAFPYFVLIIPTYFLSIYLKKQDAKWIVGGIALEAIVVILEWYFGVSTFDTSLSGFREFSEGGLMYSNRPIGLSDNSSLVAYKLILGWMLVDYFRFKNWFFGVLKGVILVALVLTFNRSVLISFLIYIALFGFKQVFTFQYDRSKAVLWLIFGVIGVFALAITVYSKIDVLIGQFTRNTGEIELTGRQYIWLDFWEFIKQNLAWGNASIKLWLDSYHAHNSYIQVIATNGVFIASLYFTLIYRNIRLHNISFVLPILVLGLTQYAFYWGISFLDIIMGTFLYQGSKAIN